jgi:hypothetical protein
MGARRAGDALGILAYLRIPPLVNTPERPSPPAILQFLYVRVFASGNCAVISTLTMRRWSRPRN